MYEYDQFLDPEAEEVCPYDKSHMVRRKRMQYHLMKCRKNHPGKDFATCPFNACHEMPRPELRYHIANCPDKATIEKDLAYERERDVDEGSMFKGCTDVPAYNSYEVSCEESWDEDVNPHPRIGVEEVFMEKVKFKNITGMTPAEKRQFHRTLNPEHIPPEERASTPEKENCQPVGLSENIKPQPEGKLRLPRNASKAYTMYQGETHTASKNQPPPTVFAYSLAQSGLGRGRGVGLGRGIHRPDVQALAVGVQRPGDGSNRSVQPPPPSAQQLRQPVSQYAPAFSGRGRSVPQAVHTVSQYNQNSSASNGSPQFNPNPSGVSNGPPEYNPYSSPQFVTPVAKPSPMSSARAAPQSQTPQFNREEQPYVAIPASTAQYSNQLQYGGSQWTSEAPSRIQVPAGIFPKETRAKPVGRGRGSQAAPVSNWPSLGGREVNNLVSVMNSHDSGSSDSGSDKLTIRNHGMEGAKKKKQMQKKLRQIEILEEKMAKGITLNTEEEIKLSKKDELLEELSALTI